MMDLISQYNKNQKDYFVVFSSEEPMRKIRLVVNTHPILEPMVIFDLSMHEWIFNPRWNFAKVTGIDVSKLVGKTTEEIINLN